MNVSENKRKSAMEEIELYRILDFDKMAAQKFSKLKYDLEKSGNVIPLFDIINASIALSHGSILVTNDSHYKRIKELDSMIIKI